MDAKAFGSEAANYSVDSITYKVGKSAVDVTGRIVLDCNWDTDARGRSDVPSASAAAVTSTTWKDVAGDLEPNAGGVPKRKKYWAPDLTSKHEKYHASDDIGRATLYRPTAEVWLNTQTVDPAKAEVAALMDKARGMVKADGWAWYNAGGEDRAYADGKSSYEARTKEVKDRATTEGWK